MSFLYDSLHQSFGLWLKARRRVLGLTRTQVAEQSSYSVAMLKKVELGLRKPSRELASELIEVLKVPPEQRDAFFTSAHSGIVEPSLAPLSHISSTQLQNAVADVCVDATEPATSKALSIRALRELPQTRYATLPYSAAPLVGRDDDINAVLALLAQPDHRLVTLVGAPGVGKTQLALAVGGRVGGIRGVGSVGGVGGVGGVKGVKGVGGVGGQNVRVGFVALAEEYEAERLPMLIGEALGLAWPADLHPSKNGPTQTLLSLLQDQSCLIILDSIEPLRDTAAFVTFINAVLSSAPTSGLSGHRIQLLLTSRMALHLSSEYIYQVAPLTVPDLDDPVPMVSWQHAPSLKLLLDRILFYNPHFQVNPANVRAAAFLCVQLDGLPLALELAAARSKTLNLRLLLEPLQHTYLHYAQLRTNMPPVLAAGLDRSILPLLANGPRDLPERARSLTSAIGWSYHRLSAAEQIAFETLACFEQGFTYGSATEVGIAVEMVEVLAAQSLLEMETLPNGELRFHMLKVIREYARLQVESRQLISAPCYQPAYPIAPVEFVLAG